MIYLFAALSVIFLALWIRERRKLDDCEFLLELEKNWERRYHEMNEAHAKNSEAKDRLINESNKVIGTYQELNKENMACIENLKANITLMKKINELKDARMTLLNKK